MPDFDIDLSAIVPDKNEDAQAPAIDGPLTSEPTDVLNMSLPDVDLAAVVPDLPEGMTRPQTEDAAKAVASGEPATQAEVRNLSERYDLPRKTTSIDLTKQRERATVDDALAVLKHSEATANWLREHWNDAPIFKDDLSKLTTIEDLMAQIAASEELMSQSNLEDDEVEIEEINRRYDEHLKNMGTPSEFFKGAQSGWIAAEQAKDWARYANGEIERDEEFIKRDKERDEKLRELQSDKFWWNAGQVLGIGAGVMAQGTEGAAVGGVMATGAAMAGVAPPTAPFVLGAMVLGGSVYGVSAVEGGLMMKELTEAGVPVEDARRISGVVGYVNSAIEVGGVKVVGSAWKKFMTPAIRSATKKYLAKELMKPTVYEAVKQFAKASVVTQASELGTELTQETVSALGGELGRIIGETGRPAMTIEEYGERIGEVALQTIQGTAGLQIIGFVPALITRSHRIYRAELQKDAMLRIVEQAKQISAAQTSPGATSEVIQAQGEANGIENVYIDGYAFRQTVLNSNISMDEFRQAFPDIYEQIERASDKGTDVVIPVGKYAERIAVTDLGTKLADHTRFTEDGLSAAEARKLGTQKKSFVQAMQEAIEDPLMSVDIKAAEKAVQDAVNERERANAQAYLDTLKNIRQESYDKFVAAGFKKEAAQVQSAMYGKMFATLAKGVNFNRGVLQRMVLDLSVAVQKAADDAQKFQQRSLNQDAVLPDRQSTDRGPLSQNESATGLDSAPTVLEAEGTLRERSIEKKSESVNLNELISTTRDELSESASKVLDAIDAVLNGNPVAELSGAEFQRSKDGPKEKDLHKRAAAFWKERYNGIVTAPGIGDVILDESGANDSIAHGIGAKKAAAFAAVPEVIRNGVVFDYRHNWKGRGWDSYVIAAPITIGGERYCCEVIVRRLADDRNKFYLHEVNLVSDVAATIQDLMFREGEQPRPARPVRSILVQRFSDHKEEFDFQNDQVFKQTSIADSELKEKPKQGERVPYGQVLADFIGDDQEKKAAVDGLLKLMSTEYQKQIVAESKDKSQLRYQKVINDRVKKAAEKAGIDLEDKKNAVTQEVLINTIINDALYVTEVNATAIGWYDEKVRKCLAFAGAMFPELDPSNAKFDKNDAFVFLYVLATTSNGLKVSQNLPLAVRIYREYRQTGVIPAIGEGSQSEPMIKTLADFPVTQATLDGIDMMRKFFMTEWTVNQLKMMGYDVGGEGSNEVVRGAAIIGPKIGNGFFSNLNGLFDALTMDRWFMRTFGRWTGTLIAFKAENFRDKVETLRGVLNEVKDNEKFCEYIKKEIGYDIKAWAEDKTTVEHMIEVEESLEAKHTKFVNACRRAHSKFMPKDLRTEYSKKWGGEDEPTSIGWRFYTALVAVSRNAAADKVAPGSPNERQYVRSLFKEALKVLNGYEGLTRLNMADLQAALWYAEKKIYENTTSKGLDFVEDYEESDAPDYANVMRKVALESGVSEETLKAIEARVDKEIADEESGRVGQRARYDTLDDGGRNVLFGSRIFGALRSRRALSVADDKKQGKRGSVVYRDEREVESSGLHASVGSDVGQPSDMYSGGPAGRRGKLRVLKPIATWKPGDRVKRVLQAFQKFKGRDKDSAAPIFNEYAPTEQAAADFLSALKEAKASLGPAGACVEEKSIEELTGQDERKSQCRIFLSEDKKSGFVIKNGDDLVSVFSARGTNSGDAIVECAIAAGARRLDCFNTILPDLYARHGFVPVAKLKFNREFAPYDWDYDFFSGKQITGKRKDGSDKYSINFNDGEPDIIFMVYDNSRQKLYRSNELAAIPYTDGEAYGEPYVTDAVNRLSETNVAVNDSVAQAVKDDQRAKAKRKANAAAKKAEKAKNAASEKPPIAPPHQGVLFQFSSLGLFAPNDDLIQSAKQTFGVTNDPREAFYILPDGTMLDGSGRHWGGDERDVAGQRQVDHADIQEVMDSSGAQAMYDFMAQTGAMRFDYSSGVSSIARPPTDAQLSALGKFSKGKYWALSFNTPEGRIVDDTEFESASPKKIEEFFNKSVEKAARGVAGAYAQAAFHGSPHVFDKFTLEHIGSGEGAQAHGWGLYFSLVQGVAEKYRDKLRLLTPDELADDRLYYFVEIWKKQHDINSEADEIAWIYENIAADTLPEEYYSGDNFMLDGMTPGRLKEAFGNPTKEEASVLAQVFSALYKANDDADMLELTKDMTPEAQDYVKNVVMNDATYQPYMGRVYAVEIPEDNVMLREEDMFDRQPEVVKRAIENILGPSEPTAVKNLIKKISSFGEDCKGLSDAIKKLADLERRSRNKEDVYYEQQAVFDEIGAEMEKIGADKVADILLEISDDPYQKNNPNFKEEVAEMFSLGGQNGYIFATDVSHAVTADIHTETKYGSYKSKNGREILALIEKKHKTAKKAAMALLAEGVYGVRYNGRRDGECAVVWSEEAIKIREILEQQNADPEADMNGYFDPSQNLLRLTPNADLSTFSHELSHWWLNWAIEIAKQPDCDAAFKADILSMLNSWGCKDIDAWNTLSFIERSKRHEEFAGYTEIYLANGRVDKYELTGVLHRIGDFVRTAYGAMTAAGGVGKRYRKQFNEELPALSPEVERVIRRMIDADADAKRGEAIEELMPLFRERPEGMSDDDWNEIQRLKDLARADTADALRAAQSKDDKWYADKRGEQLRKMDREAAKRRKEIRDIVEEEVSRRKEFVAADIISGRNRAQVAINLRLDPEQLEGLNVNQIAQLRNMGLLRKGGVSPAFARQAIERFAAFKSDKDLINALLKAGDREQMIEEETTKRCLEQYSDLFDPKKRDKVITDALVNDARSRLIATELKFIIGAKGIRARNLIAAARAVAKETIAGMPMKEARVRKFMTLEARSSRQAEEAMLEGRTMDALTFKRQQLVHHECAILALKVEKDSRNLSNIKKRVFRSDKKLAKSYDVNLINICRALLSAYGYGENKKGKPIEPQVYIDRVKEYSPEVVDGLQDLINRHSAVMSGFTGKPITVGEMMQLVDDVKMLLQMSAGAKQLLLEDRAVKLDQAVSELIAQTATLNMKEFSPGKNEATTKAEKAKSLTFTIHAWVTRVDHWCKRMDGEKDNGPFTRYIFRPIASAAARFRVANVEMQKQLSDILKPMEKKWSQVKDIEAPELNYVFHRKSELIGLLLHIGNESNYRKLVLGGRGKDAPWGVIRERPDGSQYLDDTNMKNFIARCFREGIVTKEDMDAVQAVWDLLESTKPLAQKAFNEYYGYNFEEVEAQMVATPWGFYRGGYVPAATSPDIVGERSQQIEMDMYHNSEASREMIPIRQPGFSKSRVENYTKALDLNIGNIGLHLTKVMKFAYIAPTVKDVQAIIRDKDFVETIERFDKKAIPELLMPWLMRSATQTVSTPSNEFGRWLNRFRGLAGMSLMAGNIANALQQLTGFVVAQTLVPAKYLAVAQVNCIGNAALRESVMAMSPFMKDRLESMAYEYQSEINRLSNPLEPSSLSKVSDWIWGHAYFMQTFVQKMVDIPVWVAAFNHAKAMAMSDEEAVAHADDVVRQTQSAFDPEAVARVETGGPLFRSLLVFYNYFNMQYNLMQRSYKNIHDIKSFGGFLADAATVVIIPAVLSELIAQAFTGFDTGDDDDWDALDALRLIFSSTFKNVVAMLPFVGNVINMAGTKAVRNSGEETSEVFQWLFGSNPMNDRLVSVPVLSLGENAIEGVVQTMNLIADEDYETNARRYTRNMLDVMSVVTGLPFGSVKKPAGYVAGYASGDIDPGSASEFLRGLIAGKDISSY